MVGVIEEHRLPLEDEEVAAVRHGEHGRVEDERRGAVGHDSVNANTN